MQVVLDITTLQLINQTKKNTTSKSVLKNKKIYKTEIKANLNTTFDCGI